MCARPDRTPADGVVSDSPESGGVRASSAEAQIPTARPDVPSEVMDVPDPAYDVPVDNFDVVQALVRSALGGSPSALNKQVERLIERLETTGDKKDAAALRALLARSTRVQAVEPLSLEPSSARAVRAVGQRLTPKTAVPVDRESSAPLCELLFPTSERSLPVLPARALTAYESLVHEWRLEEELREFNLRVSRSLLIYGPPGTGKTTLALAIASHLRLPAVVARLDGLISSLLGNTARNLGALFDFCNRYECVLIIDEFDAVAKVRDDSNEVGEIKRVVNALLQNLDKRADFGLTIAITNHESLLDSAVWRRFEHQILMNLPDSTMRHEIALQALGNFEEREPLAHIIAMLTEGRSGADVKTLSVALVKNSVLFRDTQTPPAGMLRRSWAVTGIGDADVLDLSDPNFARAIHSTLPEVSVGDLGATFGRDRKTISRWLAMSE